MIIILNDPIQTLVDTINDLYPDVNCEIQYNPDLNEKVSEIWMSEENGNLININPYIPFTAIVETIAHEFSHIVSKSKDNIHNGEWRETLNNINKKYQEKINSEFTKVEK